MCTALIMWTTTNNHTIYLLPICALNYIVVCTFVYYAHAFITLIYVHDIYVVWHDIHVPTLHVQCFAHKLHLCEFTNNLYPLHCITVQHMHSPEYVNHNHTIYTMYLLQICALELNYIVVCTKYTVSVLLYRPYYYAYALVLIHVHVHVCLCTMA